MNIITNSIEAIEGRPEPWITIEMTVLEHTYQIEITDSGRGIPDAVQEQIFDPYVTSKLSNENQGLGLAISRKLLELHGGSLNLDPFYPNTRFIVEVPKPS
jgi:signal transduction histidine kinase